MTIQYDHAKNIHGQVGPRIALPLLFEGQVPLSVLDVGCGTGTWLRAVLDYGIKEIFGVDGVASPKQLLFPPEHFCKVDLTQSWSLRRRFDLVFCLEVAEHLEEIYAPSFVESLTAHSGWIIFSAACPGQPGQHHVNCRWPMYWQELFNRCGYVCSDSVRWRIWNEGRIEPWYRQNMFVARRDPLLAGREPRILSVLHPALAQHIFESVVCAAFPGHVRQIERGQMSVNWYLTVSLRALFHKLMRRL